jgi:hypothetical protein
VRSQSRERSWGAALEGGKSGIKLFLTEMQQANIYAALNRALVHIARWEERRGEKRGSREEREERREEENKGCVVKMEGEASNAEEERFIAYERRVWRRGKKGMMGGDGKREGNMERRRREEGEWWDCTSLITLWCERGR